MIRSLDTMRLSPVRLRPMSVRMVRRSSSAPWPHPAEPSSRASALSRKRHYHSVAQTIGAPKSKLVILRQFLRRTRGRRTRSPPWTPLRATRNGTCSWTKSACCTACGQRRWPGGRGWTVGRHSHVTVRSVLLVGPTSTFHLRRLGPSAVRRVAENRTCCSLEMVIYPYYRLDRGLAKELGAMRRFESLVNRLVVVLEVEGEVDSRRSRRVGRRHLLRRSYWHQAP